MNALRCFTFVTVALTSSCHPLAGFHPADLPREQPLILVSNDAFPKSDVEIHVDELGIPHIFGKSEADLAYGLGIMQGRDRLFQIMLFMHAGEGRITELLGPDYLEVDRQNRLLMHNADAQLAGASPRDKAIIEAFVAGVNESARTVGRSAEMAVLGVDWEPMTPRDVLAIVRLQQWDQGVGFEEELARWRLVKQLGAESPVAKALLVDAVSGGVPVVDVSEHDGEPFMEPRLPMALLSPTEPQEPRASSTVPSAPSGDVLAAMKREIAEPFLDGGVGASNSWSVAPAHTEKGVAVLCNDPHLSHGAPGIFYMVDMHLLGAGKSGTEQLITGATFPGIPAVLIGHGSKIAWGVTNAYADTQDIVVIERKAGSDSYVVDGSAHAFGHTKQTFKLGKGADAQVIEETWLTTMFGPVLPPGYGSYGQKALVDEGETLALLWTATEFTADHANFATAFWDLAQAANVEQATAALQNFTAPAMNVNMAFTDGTIAYRLSGIVPVRGDAQRVDFPRRATSKDAGWIGRVPAAQKPQSTNPAKGFINATNQRVVENGVLSQQFVGFEGVRPWRALRVDARIRALIDGGKKAKTDDLLAIQQDIIGMDAVQLAAILASHCKGPVEGHDDDRVAAFCKAVGAFDGVYTVDALAVPFMRLTREFHLEVLKAHLEPGLANDVYVQGWSSMAMHELIKSEHAGHIATPLFDDPRTPQREGLDGFVARGLKAALDLVVAEAGGGEGDWRWGKLHTLSLRGALAGAPVIGGLFSTSAREESGTSQSPRAEGSDFGNKMRVRTGAGLRLVAEMTDPPTIRMVNDSGQSGHFGHRHLEDQYPLWTKGEPPVLTRSKAAAVEKREGAIVIKPRRS